MRVEGKMVEGEEELVVAAAVEEVQEVITLPEMTEGAAAAAVEEVQPAVTVGWGQRVVGQVEEEPLGLEMAEILTTALPGSGRGS